MTSTRSWSSTPMSRRTSLTYLGRYDNPKTAPASVSPFGIELIHNPLAEPEPLADDQPILSRRQVFRANANYSKPCVLRKEAGFTAGGHANSHQPRVLDPHLYLIHLRFFDHDMVHQAADGSQGPAHDHRRSPRRACRRQGLVQ